MVAQGLKAMVLLAPMVLLSMCGTTTGNLCSAGPFVPDPGFEERWTRAEKEQALTLNDSGRDVCNWTPGRG